MENVNFKNQILVHLSTVAVPKNSNRSWVNIQSAHWVNIRSASTIKAKKELNAFLDQWLTNLIEQGHSIKEEECHEQ